MPENSKFIIKKKQELPIDIAKCLQLVQKIMENLYHLKWLKSLS